MATAGRRGDGGARPHAGGAAIRVRTRRRFHDARGRKAVAALLLLLLCTSGCAHVKPHQREYLADRIMDPAAARRETASERKMLSTREGAAGGALGTGGGCACN